MKKLFSIFILLSMVLMLSAQEESESKTLKPALLIIDVQKQYIPYMSQEDQDLAIHMMNWTMMIFRNYDLPVIRVYHTDPEGGFTEDSPGFAFHDSLQISEDDPMIIKTYGSSFTKTNLDEILKEKDINTLFLCGLSSVGCVLATYMDAASHDYKAFMIKDAMICHNEEYTNSIEEIFNAMDLETLMFMLEVGLK